MKKRFPVFLLVLAMVLTLTAPAFAADSDFTIEDGVLTKYNGPGGAVVIPDDVTSIGWSVFENCTSLTSVDIPSNVTYITPFEFSGCTSLTSVTISFGVASIGYGAFHDCTSLISVDIPSSVTGIGYGAFYGCRKLTDVSIPSGVTYIGWGAFSMCTSLTNAKIPSGITNIETNTFYNCTSLTSVSIPSSVTSIEKAVFLGCTSLTDVYYSGSRAQWNAINIGECNNELNRAKIHYNSASTEYIYDVPDPGEDMALPVDRLDKVTDPASAASAVKFLTDSMTSEQKQAPTCVDLATLFAENAVAKAASKAVNQSEIIVSAATVADLEEIAVQADQSVEAALSNGGVTTVRDLAAMVTLTTETTGELTIRVEPSILTTGVDKVRISTSAFALVLDIAELEEVLTEDFVFTAEDVGTGFGPGTPKDKPTVNVKLPKTATITVALPTTSGKTTYQTVVNTEGTATASKYNPATTKIEGKVNTSGKYTVTTNEVEFSDISSKSTEMQQAIRYLASKGIITGTTTTTFSPDSNISRAEIAALLVRALGWNDNSATSTFKDVSRNNWYYSAAASSQRHGLINGFPDNTFQGGTVISKEQILAVSSRVLVNKMGYRIPANPSSYLTRYKDGVTNWAQGEVALATKENLVIYRVDGTFKGAGNMTRGDAAIVVYRLFQKIW